ncbi:MAG: phenylalanine--tRNA ligase subunit beta [Bacteroidales bacterium]|nr:phenylalanine--tRNA ligase subunit beta [Bacteroidales bacterium]
MKISYNWLKDYLNINLSDDELSETLTEIGLEVSKVEKYLSVKGGMEGLVIGEVLTCVKHPNADKLSVTTVNIGDKILPIVCGAPNVDKGQKVVVATVGAKMFDGENEFEIKKSKIRGENSEGMICAEDEIGLGDDHDGIMVLSDDAKIGTLAKDFFNIYEDTVFEIDLTPNRPDAISHFGVARDLYAYLKINTDLDLELKLPDVSGFKVDNNNLNIEVEVNNTEACPHYSGITAQNLDVKPSPEWMQNRLKAIGAKPINNVVDITNYILHEIGHPLHAFDAKHVTNNKVVVSTVNEGAKFTTLDERELELSEKDLMICDANLKPMCIGGVLGGNLSGVKNETKEIFIESAFFNPVWVRKSAKRHAISTDASYRFERGVDPNNCIWTLKRAATMMKEIANAEISSDIKDIYPEKLEDFKVELTFKQLDKIVGFVIDRELVKKILNFLEIKIIFENDEKLDLEVPTYRFEMRREADVIEDIIRIYGYNKIPLPEELNTKIIVQQRNKSEVLRQKASHLLTAQGFYEIMSFSLLDRDILKNLGGYSDETVVPVHNPLSKNLDTMRQSLIFGALDAVQRNISVQNQTLKLFEFGSTYFKTNSTEFEGRYIQKYNLSLTLSGIKEKPNWKTTEQNFDFYSLKSYAETVLKGLGLSVDKLTVFDLVDDTFKYGLEYKMGKNQVMKFGAVSRKMLKIYGIDQDVFFAEIDWGFIFDKTTANKPFNEIVKYPKVKRDLALLIDEKVKYSEIEKIGRETDKKTIKEVNIFDVYQGKNIPSGKKSYAVSFVLQDENKTLNDKAIDKVINKLIYNYQNKLSAELR